MCLLLAVCDMSWSSEVVHCLTHKGCPAQASTSPPLSWRGLEQ